MERKGRIELTRALLREVAGSVYFARGEAYFNSGAVQAVRERNGIIRATVHGTEPYKTSLSMNGDNIEGSCSCPLGEEYEFCKHLVATGLAYIEYQKDANGQGKKGKHITPKEIKSYLLQQDVPDLVCMIMKQADMDAEFYTSLKLQVATEAASSNITELKCVLKQAMTIRDFISWRETIAYKHGIDRVLDQLHTMLTPKHASQVIELVEYGMDLWEENINSIDDSNGCMGILQDDLHQLHLKACKIAKPEPVALAERLALRAINSEWEMFFNSYESYKAIFGEAGCARYREIVEAEWNALPHISPGEEDPGRYGRNHTLEHMMLIFAEEEDDLDLAIRVLSRDLSHSYSYLLIAQRCQEAHNYDLAREWAEKGIAAFADNPDSRLRSFLADEYLRAKRPDDVMAMIWANFEDSTSLASYQDLAKYAIKLKRWDTWRKKAFTHIRANIKNLTAEINRQNAVDTQKQTGYFRLTPIPPDHTLLVSILLWEKREDDAWAEAKKGGCSEQLWLDLAKRREQKHPEDAIDIYQRQVLTLINQTNNHSYKQAVEYIERINGLMKKIGKEKEFRIWLSQLKSEYKRKRNFIKYVEQWE